MAQWKYGIEIAWWNNKSKDTRWYRTEQERDKNRRNFNNNPDVMYTKKLER